MAHHCRGRLCRCCARRPSRKLRLRGRWWQWRLAPLGPAFPTSSASSPSSHSSSPSPALPQFPPAVHARLAAGPLLSGPALQPVASLAKRSAAAHAGVAALRFRPLAVGAVAIAGKMGASAALMQQLLQLAVEVSLVARSQGMSVPAARQLSGEPKQGDGRASRALLPPINTAWGIAGTKLLGRAAKGVLCSVWFGYPPPRSQGLCLWPAHSHALSLIGLCPAARGGGWPWLRAYHLHSLHCQHQAAHGARGTIMIPGMIEGRQGPHQRDDKAPEHWTYPTQAHTRHMSQLRGGKESWASLRASRPNNAIKGGNTSLPSPSKHCATPQHATSSGTPGAHLFGARDAHFALYSNWSVHLTASWP